MTNHTILQPENLLLLGQWSSLSGVYIVSLIVGGGLLLISTIMGGHADSDVDADFDADFGADVDADFDADVELDADVDADTEVDAIGGHDAAGGFSLASWISLRFVVYFMAMFGMVGTVLTYTSQARPPMVLLWAMIGGMVIGQVAHQVFRYLKRSSVDSSVTLKDYINHPARVTIAIKPPARGEVAIQMGNSERFVPARAKRGQDHFKAGQSVGVVGFQNGTAVVVGKDEFEFLSTS